MDFELGPSYALLPSDYSPITGMPGATVPTLKITRKLKLPRIHVHKPNPAWTAKSPKAPATKSASTSGSTRAGTPASPTLSVVQAATPAPPPTAAVAARPFSHYP